MRSMVSGNIKEAQFEQQVKQLALMSGYLYYHTWRSMHSPAGFPDCVMLKVDPVPRLIFVELKSEKGELTFEQYAWLCALQEIGRQTEGMVDAYLWKPSDWEEVQEIIYNQRFNTKIERGGDEANRKGQSRTQ